MPWQVPGYRPREDLVGGAGRVVLATDESTGELVVIKHLNPDSSYTADDLRSAIDEIGALPDDYFVRIRELVQDSGHNAIVMDPVNGTTMRALIRDDGPFDPESALIMFRDILNGLTYAHALDIVHGDVSPDNVMISADGRPVMLNAGAVTWDRREPTLSSGVYLAPERWRGAPPTAAADVYAATVGFVESLTGEPPYWEDSDLERLHRRHDSEDLDLAEVPPALHDVVRAGMAKNAGSRMAAGALLDLVETAAIAGYGRDWPDRARDGVIRRVRSGSLPVGGEPVADAGGDARDAEDVANDDYYADSSSDANADTSSDADAAPAEPPTDGSPPTDDSPLGSASGDAASEAVMAAAAEIVAFAQLRDAAEADAVLAASADEELTEEEESAVAEIERLLFLDEQSPAEVEASTSEPTEGAGGEAAEATSTAESPDDAATGVRGAADAGAGATAEPEAAADAVAPSSSDRVPAQSPPGVERSPVESEPDRAPSEAGSDRVPAPAASAESIAAAEVVAGNAVAEHAAGAAGTAEPSASPSRSGPKTVSEVGAPTSSASGDQSATQREPVPAGATTGTDGRRRPWWLTAGAVAAILAVAGLLSWAAVGLSGSSTRPAAAASSRPVATATPTGAPSVSVPASAGAPPIGTPTGPSTPPPATASSTGTAPSLEPSAGASGTGSAAPTLPLTGFEHPIRLMAAIAALFILAGTVLVCAGRRRDEMTADARLRARTRA
jgi:serine/threonine-protein kinase